MGRSHISRMIAIAGVLALAVGCASPGTNAPTGNSIQVKGQASSMSEALQQIRVISDEAATKNLER